MARLAKPAWPKSGDSNSAPVWYSKDVFRMALRRVVAVLNADGACSAIKLDQSDGAIAAAFDAAGLDALLIQYNTEAPDTKARSDEHDAEYHFYANIRFDTRKDNRVAVFKVPQPFLDWGYQNLRRPAVDPLLVEEFPGGTNDPDYVRHCATNYLVKNFWHNFVHVGLQGITNENYHVFRGFAREDSDFEADHIANILTLLSYGVPPRYNGRRDEAIAARIEAIFTRNRCNQVFAERARHRLDDAASQTAEQRWAETEWRFCRGVANRVSIALLAAGLATPSLKILLGGEVCNGRKGVRWRNGPVLAEVGGLRIATKCPAYIPDDEWRAFGGEPITVKRAGDIRRRRAEREQEVAASIRESYRHAIHIDTGLRQAIGLKLEALARHIGVSQLGIGAGGLKALLKD